MADIGFQPLAGPGGCPDEGMLTLRQCVIDPSPEMRSRIWGSPGGASRTLGLTMMRRGGLGVIASGLAALLLAGCQTVGTDQAVAGAAVAHAPVGSEGVPNDRALGKKAFRNQSFGLAEMHFRRAVESNARDAESWLGLAASYDHLRRFDLADRAYGRAIGLAGQTPEILNNRGYSYMLRGDLPKARRDLNAARAKDPENPLIANNLKLLDEQGRLGR